MDAQTSTTFKVGTQPTGIIFDGTNIWVANQLSYSVTKVLGSNGAVLGTYPIGGPPSSPAWDGGFPSALAFDGTNIWVPSGNQVTKLLASTGARVGSYLLPSLGANGVVFDGTDIWVSNGNGVTKMLASTGAILNTYNLGAGAGTGALAFDGTNVWVTAFNGVAKLVASTGANLGIFGTGQASALAFDGTNIWVTNIGNVLTKLLPSSSPVFGPYPTYPVMNPNGIAFDGTNIWATNYCCNTVTKLLASTGAILNTYPVGSGPSGVVSDGTNIWVTNSGDDTVTKISSVVVNAPSISPAGVVPLYSTVNTIQPGEWISIWGNNLSSGIAFWNGDFPTSLGGTSVRINGKAAYLLSVSPGQINLQAPDDTATGAVPVVVTTANGSTASTVTLSQLGPSFLLYDTKHVAGIILRTNGSGAYGSGTYDILGPTTRFIGGSSVAAKAGDTVELFGVGFGPTTPAVPAGRPFSAPAPTTHTVQVSIGGTTVTPFFSGLSSAGLYQFNLTIPASLGSGDQTLTATVGGVQTQSGVVISLQ